MPAWRTTFVHQCQYDARNNRDKTPNTTGNKQDPRSLRSGGCFASGFDQCHIKQDSGSKPCCGDCKDSVSCDVICRLERFFDTIPIQDCTDTMISSGVNAEKLFLAEIERRGYEVVNKKQKMLLDRRAKELEDQRIELEAQKKMFMAMFEKKG